MDYAYTLRPITLTKAWNLLLTQKHGRIYDENVVCSNLRKILGNTIDRFMEHYVNLKDHVSNVNIHMLKWD